MEPPRISARQCRMARSGLRISQADLAGLSNISSLTVANFESGFRKPIPLTVSAMQTALEKLGAVFVDNGVVIP